VSLGRLYEDYLRTRPTPALVDALEAAGLVAEAELLSRWSGAQFESTVPAGPWAGRSVTASLVPPAPREPGELWFDPLELVLMLLTAAEPLDPHERYAPEAIANYEPFHSWLATRAVGRWQLAAFLALAEIRPRTIQVEPAIKPFDPDRILAGDEFEPAVGLTYGEAALFANWLGKLVADVDDWAAAARILGPAEIAELWGSSRREWGGKIDEGVALAIGREDLDEDGDELVAARVEGSVFGEGSAPVDVGVRTRVSTRFGLLREPAVDPTWFEPVQFAAVLPRDG
jgi:hypothetical protein